MTIRIKYYNYLIINVKIKMTRTVDFPMKLYQVISNAIVNVRAKIRYTMQRCSQT